MFSFKQLDFETDGQHWPHREASRFVEHGGKRWHVQLMGAGPVVLLLHGTSASTHSWRDLMPILSKHYTVVALDLPGHGFSTVAERRDLTLNGMAKAIVGLLHKMKLEPDYAVGHSAGAALAIWATLGRMIEPKAIVSINGALYPFSGWAGRLFPGVAKVLFVNRWTPKFFAGQATSDSVERLINQTGSKLDEEGLDFYLRLIQNPNHVAAALGMMANWNLNPLVDMLPVCETPLHLIVGADDEAVPPSDALKILKLVPHGTLHELADLGHLAHEEDPVRVAGIIKAACAQSTD